MGWLTGILIVALLAIWIVCGYFITQASVDLTSYKSKDNDLDNAYWYTFWGAFVTWFLVGLAIIFIIGLIVLAVFFAPEEAVAAEGGAELVEAEAQVNTFTNLFRGYAKQQQQGWLHWLGGWFVTGTLIIATILVSLSGILAALAADSIHASTEPKEGGLKQAYDDCILAAVLALTAVGVLVIAAIIYEVLDYRKRHPSLPPPAPKQETKYYSPEPEPEEAPPKKEVKYRSARASPKEEVKYYSPQSSPQASTKALPQASTTLDVAALQQAGVNLLNQGSRYINTAAASASAP